MEPFGLLNLLKTLLPPEQETASPPQKSEEEPPSPPAEMEEKPNACASFLEAHERRAKRKR